jgi:hypothetical protein
MADKDDLDREEEAGSQLSSFRGIRDWNEKRGALEPLLGAFGNQHLAEAILGYDSQTRSLTGQQAEQVNSLVGSFKSWRPGKSDPKGHVGRLFLASVAARIREQFEKQGLEPPANIGTIFLRGTYSRFYELIPGDRRTDIDPPRSTRPEDPLVSAKSTPVAPAPSSSNYHPFWIHRDARSETPKDGLVRGRIDQNLIYLTPDSADPWKGIIDADQYHQYEEVQLCTSEVHDRGPMA